MATPDGDSLDVNVVAVLAATAPADRAPTRTAQADTLPAVAQPVPVDTDWAADTPVQVAYLEGVDDPAPAATDDTPLANNTDECESANDGVCDEPSLCALGTDADDCNPSNGQTPQQSEP